MTDNVAISGEKAAVRRHGMAVTGPSPLSIHSPHVGYPAIPSAPQRRGKVDIGDVILHGKRWFRMYRFVHVLVFSGPRFGFDPNVRPHLGMWNRWSGPGVELPH